MLSWRAELNLLLNIALKASQNDLANTGAGVEQQCIRRAQSCSTTHRCKHDIALTNLRMELMLLKKLFSAWSVHVWLSAAGIFGFRVGEEKMRRIGQVGHNMSALPPCLYWNIGFSQYFWDNWDLTVPLSGSSYTNRFTHMRTCGGNRNFTVKIRLSLSSPSPFYLF